MKERKTSRKKKRARKSRIAGHAKKKKQIKIGRSKKGRETERREAGHNKKATFKCFCRSQSWLLLS